MRRLFAALVVATVAFSLAGCGGGTSSETPETPAVSTSTPSSAVSDPLGYEILAAADASPLLTKYPAPFPTDPAKVPEEILDRLEIGQPMLVYYYDSTNDVTNDQDAVVSAVLGEYRGLIDVVTYDIRADLPEGELTEDSLAFEAAKWYTLAQELGVMSNPYLVLVNEEGVMTWRWRGFCDESVLEREVLFAIQ